MLEESYPRGIENEFDRNWIGISKEYRAVFIVGQRNPFKWRSIGRKISHFSSNLLELQQVIYQEYVDFLPRQLVNFDNQDLM